MLEGKNFILELEGTIRKYGFYTTRFVEAENPEKAELYAVQLIKEDEKIRKNVKNPKSDPPMLFLEKLEEVSSFEGVKLPGTGYTFFPDDETE